MFFIKRELYFFHPSLSPNSTLYSYLAFELLPFGPQVDSLFSLIIIVKYICFYLCIYNHKYTYI